MKLAPLLHSAAHSGPETLPAHRWGAPCVDDARVRPDVVIEVSVDLALDGLRWLHPVRFVRVREDLRATDLNGEN